MPSPVKIEDLAIGEPIKHSLFSANGDLLLRKSIRFSEEIKSVFIEHKIEEVFVPDKGKDDDDCRVHLRYHEKEIIRVEEHEELGLGVYDLRGRLLVKAGSTIGEGQKDTLIRQGAHLVHVKRALDTDLEQRSDSLISDISALLKNASKLALAMKDKTIPDNRLFGEGAKLDRKAVDSATDEESARTIELNELVRKLVEPKRLTEVLSEEDLVRVANTRQSLYERVVEIFGDIKAGKTIDGRLLIAFVNDMISSLVSDSHHRLYLTGPKEDNYLASHSLTTAVVSINAAARMDYALEELIELGVSALLHDIGMLKLSSKITEKTESLSGVERRKIEMHPSYGLDYCQQIRRLPKSTPVVILQENERLDGSGYPLKRKGNLHPFVNIISLVSSFDAMTRDRPYRKAKVPYDAMKELLGDVSRQVRDPIAAKGMLESLSLFPIGSPVRLSDDSHGFVLDTSGAKYTRPVVCVGATRPDDFSATRRIVDLQEGKNKTTQIVEALAV